MRSSQSRWASLAPLAGFALVGLGLVLMLVGYTLAAGQPTGDLRLQFPYLLSCGLPGLALVLVGTTMVRISAARADRDAIISALRESSRPAAPVLPAQSGPPTRSHASRSSVVAGTSSYHMPECRLVEGRSGEVLEPEIARERALSPCRVCKPERVAL